jgi:FKBP-type peptidyl-prolyl cis-trans isomerase FkpA
MKKTILLLSVSIAWTILFLASCQTNNSEFPGFKKTESGLIYKINDKGTDTTQPRIGTFLDVAMTYGTEDSVLFDSRKLPNNQAMQLPMVESVHQGDIYEGFALMHPGDSATFIIPADSVWTKLFRMPSAPPQFDSVKYLYFNVRLNEVISADEMNKRKEAERKMLLDKEKTDRDAYLKENYPNAKPTVSGLYYIIQKKGSGKSPEVGDKVKVNYTGRLLDGKKFDSSIDHGKPFEFTLGQRQVIKGWDEGVALMKKGEKGILIVPSDLGYGPRGTGPEIGPYQTLVFEVELVDFTKKKDSK